MKIKTGLPMDPLSFFHGQRSLMTGVLSQGNCLFDSLVVLRLLSVVAVSSREHSSTQQFLVELVAVTRHNTQTKFVNHHLIPRCPRKIASHHVITRPTRPGSYNGSSRQEGTDSTIHLSLLRRKHQHHGLFWHYCQV